MINSFKGNSRFLSNFYMLAVPLPWETLFYPSSEHLFVMYKTLELEDRVWISTLAKPWMAKKAGGKYGYQGRKIVLRGDWNDEYNGAPIRVHVMRHVLYLKYTTNPQLIRRLCATHPKQLIEGNEWHDNYWGNCTCGGCVHIPGENLLGRLHMEHRANFMMID